MDNNISQDKKVKLWTRQYKNILKELEKHGVYRVRKEYIVEKLDSLSDYFIKVYEWYVKKAEKIVPRPEGVKYPIWLSTSSEYMLQPVDNTVILELEVNRNNVILMDSRKWDYIVNYWYVPKDEEDEIRFNMELEKYGIKDESAICLSHLGDFYPMLRNKIIKSWDRLFEDNLYLSNITQATLWEIKKEWIVRVI